MEEAAALDSAGMRQPAGGKAVDVENWMSSDSITDRAENTLTDNSTRLTIGSQDTELPS